jgi:hypothetical protein
MESLWPRLAELPLIVEGCGYDRLHAVTQEVIAGIAAVSSPTGAERSPVAPTAAGGCGS